MLLSESIRKKITAQKIFIFFFINSDPNLTQTQILTPKLNPNLMKALSNRVEW